MHAVHRTADIVLIDIVVGVEVAQVDAVWGRRHVGLIAVVAGRKTRTGGVLHAVRRAAEAVAVGVVERVEGAHVGAVHGAVAVGIEVLDVAATHTVAVVVWAVVATVEDAVAIAIDAGPGVDDHQLVLAQVFGDHIQRRGLDDPVREGDVDGVLLVGALGQTEVEQVHRLRPMAFARIDLLHRAAPVVQRQIDAGPHIRARDQAVTPVDPVLDVDHQATARVIQVVAPELVATVFGDEQIKVAVPVVVGEDGRFAVSGPRDVSHLAHEREGPGLRQLIDEEMVRIAIGDEEVEVAVIVDITAGDPVDVVEQGSGHQVRTDELVGVLVPQEERVGVEAREILVDPAVRVEEVEVAVVVEVAQPDTALVGVRCREVEARVDLKLIQAIEVGVADVEVHLGHHKVRIADHVVVLADHEIHQAVLIDVSGRAEIPRPGLT